MTHVLWSDWNPEDRWRLTRIDIHQPRPVNRYSGSH